MKAILIVCLLLTSIFFIPSSNAAESKFLVDSFILINFVAYLINKIIFLIFIYWVRFFILVAVAYLCWQIFEYNIVSIVVKEWVIQYDFLYTNNKSIFLFLEAYKIITYSPPEANVFLINSKFLTMYFHILRFFIYGTFALRKVWTISTIMSVEPAKFALEATSSASEATNSTFEATNSANARSTL